MFAWSLNTRPEKCGLSGTTTPSTCPPPLLLLLILPVPLLSLLLLLLLLAAELSAAAGVNAAWFPFAGAAAGFAAESMKLCRRRPSNTGLSDALGTCNSSKEYKQVT
jgi:hypothetical protein